MREVKKYDPFGYDGLSAFMHEDQYGSWVHEDDFDAQAAELAEAQALLSILRGMINCTPENDIDRCGAWISTKHPVIKRIDAFLDK